MPISFRLRLSGLVCVTLSTLLLHYAALGQDTVSSTEVGTIAGVLVDGESGETLIGAAVRIEGTLIGSATNLNGRYKIRVAAGTYQLEYSYIGYNTVVVQNAQVEPGATTQIDITLYPEAVAVEEVVVEAAALRNTEASLLRERTKAVAVSDAISAEAIGRSGSGDAAAAMTKVTGASVVGGRYVYIRGLGDRYANTTLNGSTLPSADPDKKAVQLDLFPAALLDNIVTLKTFTPDKPGDFSGGLVDISTKTFPDRFTLQLSATMGYDDLASGNDAFLSYQGSSTDWLGRDDGMRDLPDILADKDPEDDLPTERDLRDLRPGVTNEDRTARADSLNVFAGAFNSVMTPSHTTVPLNYSFSSAIGTRAQLFGNPLGVTGSLTYGRSYSYYDDGIYSQWQLTGGDVSGVDNLTSNTYFGPDPDLGQITRADSLEAPSFANTRGTDQVNWGALGSLAYQPGSNHEIALSFLRTQSGTSEAVFLGGFRDQNSAATFITRSLDYEERALGSLQLRGDHWLKPFQIEWKLSAARNGQSEPDLRFFSSVQNIQTTGGTLDTTYTLGGGNAPPPQRYFRDLNEHTRGAILDFSIPFRQWNGLRAKLKLGGALDNSKRDFRQRRFEYVEGREIDFRDFEGDVDGYFDPDNLGVQDTIEVGAITAFNAGLYIAENSPARANYDATRSVRAGYLMLELPLNTTFKVVGGVRVEDTEIITESFDESLPDDQRLGTLDQTDLLPSLNLIVSLSDNMNLRAAATRTLARPTYRELAPFQSFNFVGGDIQEGNPQLNRTLITNLDLRWEWFVRPGEIVAASAFYKAFDQPIERVLRNVGEGRFVSFQNVDHARVYGAEFEARKRLDSWLQTPVLKHISVGGNFSLVQSTVDIPEDELVIIRASDAEASTTRSLEGQSPFLLNLSAGYENYDTGTTVSIFYTVFGDRLLAVTQGATPDVFEKARGDLTATLSQNLSGNLRLKLTATNLLGSDTRQIQTYKGQEYNYIYYSRARIFSIGINYLLD